MIKKTAYGFYGELSYIYLEDTIGSSNERGILVQHFVDLGRILGVVFLLVDAGWIWLVPPLETFDRAVDLIFPTMRLVSQGGETLHQASLITLA